MLRMRIEAAELGQLAGAGERLQIHLSADELPRLADLVVDDGDQGGGAKIVAVTIDFDQGPEGYPRMRLAVSGILRLCCQRCLHAVRSDFDLTTQLTVVSEDEQAERLAKPFDSVVMEAGVLDLATVVEDEILAALPMAPVHESEEACTLSGAQPVDLDNRAEQKYRPFESLATMVAGGDSGGDKRNSGRREK